MIRTAQAMGLLTVAVDANENAPGLAVADFGEAIDYSNIDAVLSYCEALIAKGVPLAGVSTMGSDIPHLLAIVCDHFKWPGPSLETGKWASHKYEMKRRLSTKGIPVPRYALVDDAGQILELWRKWQVEKVIIKPTDRAGSRGVRIIETAEEAKSAFEYAISYSHNGEILLEEFIDGLQISTESIILGEEAVTPGFADRVYDSMDCYWPNIMENGGWLPSSVDHEVREKISRLVENAARALGVNNGVAKGDVVICPRRGPMIIEMAARLSGGDFSESLVPLSCGINYVRTVIELSIGGKPDLEQLIPVHNKAVANRYFFPPQGVLEEIRGLAEIEKIPELHKLDIYVSAGDLLPEIDSHARRAGVFVVVGNNRQVVQEIVDDIYRTVEFKIGGKWHDASPCAGIE